MVTQLYQKSIKTTNLNKLHSVYERAGYSLDVVGGAHEQHVGEVEGEFQVGVGESVVLFRVQNFQQGGCRVSLEAVSCCSVEKEKLKTKHLTLRF